MRAPSHVVAALVLFSAVQLCACRTEPAPAAPDAAVAAVAAVTVEARAAALNERAAAAEPAITAALQALSAETGAELVKLRTRLKGRESTIRKIEKIMLEKPGTRPADVELNDTLRYTMVVGDQPPGQHVAAIRAVLGSLEAANHRLVKLKNYWQRGDNYSGVNSVLRSADGLLWELQFHTPESKRTAGGHHDLYERLRAVDTPPAEKLQIFDQMSAAWDGVPIPEKVLEPQSLHATEQILELPRPAP